MMVSVCLSCLKFEPTNHPYLSALHCIALPLCLSSLACCSVSGLSFPMTSFCCIFSLFMFCTWHTSLCLLYCSSFFSLSLVKGFLLSSSFSWASRGLNLCQQRQGDIGGHNDASCVNFGGSLQCSTKEDVIFQSILFLPGQGTPTQQVWDRG